MTKKKAAEPAIENSSEPVEVKTIHGSVTFEDFSIEQMMASFDDDDDDSD